MGRPLCPPMANLPMNSAIIPHYKLSTNMLMIYFQQCTFTGRSRPNFFNEFNLYALFTLERENDSDRFAKYMSLHFAKN